MRLPFLRRAGGGPEGEAAGDLLDPVGLELLARGLADGLLAGDAPSLFRGGGVEPDGVRPYVAGDDARTVDWRVSARTGRLHVSERVEERGVEVHLVVDRSASLHGCASPAPGRAAVRTAAALAAAALGAGRPAGLLQVTDRVEGRVPAGEGPHQLRWILASLERLRPSGSGTALGPALDALRSALGARALVAVISDFRVPRPWRAHVGAALAGLARRHDLLPIRILGPGPEDLPPVGLVRVLDPESGRGRTLDTSDAAVRERLGSEAAEAEAWRASLWSGLNLGALTVDPFEPLGPQLAAGLARRAGRTA